MGRKADINHGVINRLIELIDEYSGGVYSKFAKMLDLTPSTMQRYLVGSAAPGLDVITQICNTFGITSDWFLFGISPKYRFKRDIHELPEHSLSIITTPQIREQWGDLEDPRNFRPVPILDSIAAGPAIMVEDRDISGFAVIYQDWMHPGRQVAFRVKGDSMLPLLATGDLVGVNLDRRDPHDCNGRIIAAYVDDGITVKHFRLVPGRAILIPENIKEFTPTEYPIKSLDTLIIGAVEWSWKKMS